MSRPARRLRTGPRAVRAQGAARDTAARDSARITRLVPLVIEVTRAPTGPAESPRRVGVINRGGLERTARTSVVDVLGKLAAVVVIQSPSLPAGVGTCRCASTHRATTTAPARPAPRARREGARRLVVPRPAPHPIGVREPTDTEMLIAALGTSTPPTRK